MKKDKISKISEKVTQEVMSEFENEFQKNLKSHHDELPGLASANAFHDSIPFLISSITEKILKNL